MSESPVAASLMDIAQDICGNEAGLYEYAVKALGRRMRTEAELRRLMHARVEPGPSGEAVIAAVLARL